jgi:hypothetical protein
LTINMPFGMPKKKKPQGTFESRSGRSRLNLIESKKTPESFLANIEKMKAKAKGRKNKGCY